MGPAQGEDGSGWRARHADVTWHWEPEWRSPSSVNRSELALVFASYFLVIALSVVVISCHNGNSGEGLFSNSIHGGDRGWSPFLGPRKDLSEGLGEQLGQNSGLAADIGQQHI